MDLYKFYKKYGLFVILAIFIVVFSALNTQFLTPGNLLNILRQISMFGIVVVGYTMVMPKRSLKWIWMAMLSAVWQLEKPMKRCTGSWMR